MIHLPPIIAFGWLNLPMLGWLAAAAAPFVIHLWNRRRRRESPWAAMEFLMAAVRRQSGRLRLEQWLLLAVRTILIVLIVVAVAEPYLERSGFTLASGERTHRVLVVDGSYSMDYKAGDKSCFDRAKELAGRIVEESPQGDAFTLVLMASPPQVIVGTPALESSEVVREIDGLQITQAAADLPGTLTAVSSVVRNAQSENPRLTRSEVYFLTDLQRVTWGSQRLQATKGEFLRRSEELSELAGLTVIDLGQPNAENLAVAGVRTLDAVPTVGRTVTLEVVLRNFGPVVRRRQPVELLIDGRRVEQKQIDVAAESENSLGFTCRFETPGDHAVEVRAPGDALEIDNRRYLIVPVRESIRALCIDGRPSGIPFKGAADYLALALAPRDGRIEHAPIRPEVAAENAIIERNLAAYDCVFLCNVAQFTGAERRVLDAYLKGGGSLVVFVGDQVRADSYNRELGGGAGEGPAKSTEDVSAIPRLLPAKLGAVVERSQFRLDPLGYRHPIVQVFRGRGEAGLLTTPVFKHFKLDVSPDSSAKTVLATADGDPLIVEQAVRRGRVVLVGTSADASWTAMPLWPSFVPLVQEIAAWCVSLQSRQRNILVGEPLLVPMVAVSEAAATIVGPDGRSHTVGSATDNDFGDMRCSDTEQCGVYTLRRDSAPNRGWSFAVNVDTVESDLAQVDVDSLRDEVWPGISFVHQTSWKDADRPSLVGPSRGKGNLAVDLLYAVLGLLLFETLLAWRFGYHAT